MDPPLRTCHAGLVAAVLLVVGTISIDDLRAQDLTPAICNDSTLDSANAYYAVGMFDQAMGELRPCLPEGLPVKEQRVGAYRLMALSYIATDSLDHARQSVRALLKTDSGYKADPVSDPPLFAELIEAEQPPWYTFMWEGSSASRWAGRVAVVGAAVAVPLLLRDTSDPPLPGPPDLPSGTVP